MRLCEISFATPDGKKLVEIFSKPDFSGFYAQGSSLEIELTDTDVTSLLEKVTHYMREKYKLEPAS